MQDSLVDKDVRPALPDLIDDSISQQSDRHHPQMVDRRHHHELQQPPQYE